MKAITKALAVAAAVGWIACCSLSQASTPSTTTQKPSAHHGLLGLLHHPRATNKPENKHGMGGRIIGNKRTHVYHLPGDRGMLPADKNRVYFSTEAAAVAAGYRRAGHGGRTSSSKGHGHPHGKKPSMHGMAR